MVLLKRLVVDSNNYNCEAAVNGLRLVIRKFINNVLLLSMAITLLVSQSAVRAQEADIDGLLPALLFILDDNGIQCPTIPEEPDFIGGNNAGVFDIVNAGGFDPADLGDFLSGATSTGVGTTSQNLFDALNANPFVIQRLGDVVISTQQDIDELEGVVLITGSLLVNSASLVQELDFSPLSSLVQISGTLSFNTGNTNIEGFQCLATVGNLNIVANESLINIGGFQSLESIDGGLSVFSNNSLESISGFQSLGTIGSNLGLASNPNLESIGSLARLNREDVVGDIVISSNTNFDCSDPQPNFVTATASSGNAVDCMQDLLFRNLAVSNRQSLSIPDSGSVASTIPISSQINIDGLVQSLSVNLDITHPSVGDLTVTLSNGTTTVNLLAEPTTAASQEALLAEIANQCVDVPFETDFSEVLSSEEGLFESFPSVDAACSVEIISTFAEEFCSSNDIVVSLQDSIVSPPINTSCSSDDQGTAFSEPVYAPLEPLSAFQGDNVNQVWTLTVTDSKNGNIGTLNSWTLFFDIER